MLQKAMLKPRDRAAEIVFMFNPTEISFTRTATWAYHLGHRGSGLLPKVNFSGIQPYQLTLSNLLFDTSETEEKISVMEHIYKIKQGMSASVNIGSFSRPPVYTFIWGDNFYFDCVMENLTYKLTKFLTDGMPVRALVDLTLLEVDPATLSPSKDKID